MLDARQSGHGLKIMDDNNRVHVGPVDKDDNDEQHKRWVQSLQIDSDGEENCNSTTRLGIQFSESMEEVQVLDTSDSDEGDDDEDDVDDEKNMGVEVGAHGKLEVCTEEKQLHGTRKIIESSTTSTTFSPNPQALCQPPSIPQEEGVHPPMQCRGLKWEVLSNAGCPGMLGACCIVKERGLDDGEPAFRTFNISPQQNIWLVVRKADTIDEEALAAWKLRSMILLGIKKVKETDQTRAYAVWGAPAS